MIKRCLLAGLLVWVPIWVTLLLVRFLVDMFDRILNLLPKSFQPDNFLGFHVPGLGLALTIIIFFFTGMLVTNVVGRYLVTLWEALLARIPLVRSIYSGVKTVLQTLFSSKSTSFRQVVLVEYPRKGLWSLAFVTNKNFRYADAYTGDESLTIFLPTTPNPTSGFLIIVPKSEIKVLDISVDDALKMVISLGVVLPHEAEVVEEN